jgi:hypothetical protein
MFFSLFEKPCFYLARHDLSIIRATQPATIATAKTANKGPTIEEKYSTFIVKP